ncbi:LamG-like jellyroll fold domain-containing protein, partial [Escherichia coli]|uniref:LamG-like jellyroll fold domain-containing protein n=1 Tax=Escherichia coli TaxID=562 RepID=UPI0013661B5D
LMADNWYHIAVTFSGGNLTLYLDGTPSTTNFQQYTPLTPTSNTIGAQRTGTSSYTSYFRGELKDYRVYPYVLDPNLIKTISTLGGYDIINDNISVKMPMMGPSGNNVGSLTDTMSGEFINIVSSINFG